MDNKELFAHLIKTFFQAKESGEDAMRAGIVYNAVNKTFGIVIDNNSFSLLANFVADHPEGGDELVNRIKRWINGDRAE
jgi:hypothetical protein